MYPPMRRHLAQPFHAGGLVGRVWSGGFLRSVIANVWRLVPTTSQSSVWLRHLRLVYPLVIDLRQALIWIQVPFSATLRIQQARTAATRKFVFEPP